MPANDTDWRRAFALQAVSDLDAREVLAAAGAPLCHQLHFLQMASEKVCKAYLIQEKGYRLLKKRHDVVAGVLPVLARVIYGSMPGVTLRHGQRAAIMKVAHEIELLSPMCHEAQSRLDNSEYPWLNGLGNVQTPCLHSFQSFSDESRTLVQLIQVIRRAAKSYVA